MAQTGHFLSGEKVTLQATALTFDDFDVCFPLRVRNVPVRLCNQALCSRYDSPRKAGAQIARSSRVAELPGNEQEMYHRLPCMETTA
jgi:hypothetical protein